ncbi:transcriptional regulator [Viridibacillus sp. FSL R5-0477]|uniref:Transcriptional regulator n=1 Tax=Viridibacillus arenosi FSL R5-213 TaxID=1227360 RepID=W4F1G8_9BACL|nr:hypothetical protein C176_05597 [Viridibacillus arenosi FSL R5-213]
MDNVKEQLLKAMQRNQLVNMIYMSSSGDITKRRVKIIKISSDNFQAYCFVKRAKRTFIIENVLAAIPIIRSEEKEL